MAKLEFIRKLSQGNLFESWLAQDTKTGRMLFVKKIASSSRTLASQARERVRRSEATLKLLNHPGILRPLEVLEVNNDLLQVFPYFPSEARIEITSELLADLYPLLLPQIFQILDFIHAHGYVHGDVKRSNFLLVKNEPRPRLFLTDFDFVCQAGMRLRKQIFGAPRHIAPEIFRDDIVLPQSDHYSLGVMLCDLIRSDTGPDPFATTEDEDQRSGQRRISEADVKSDFVPLVQIVNPLLEKEPKDRPSYLGQLLLSGSPVFAAYSRSYDRKLVAATAKSQARNRARQTSGRGTLVEFVQQDLKLIGWPDEILRDAECCLEEKQPAVLRSMANLLKASRLTRVGEYWQARVELPTITGFYLQPWVPRELFRPGARGNRSDWSGKLRLALDLKMRQSHWKSLILTKELLEQPLDTLTEHERALRKMLLLRAGQLYRNCGMVKPSQAMYQEFLSENSLSPRKRLLALLRLADRNLIGQDRTRRKALLDQAGRLARSERLLRARVHVLLQKQWQSFEEGDQQAALRRLETLTRIAGRSGFVDSCAWICNLMGILYRSLGQLDQARSALLDGIAQLAKAKSLTKPVALYGNLAMVEFDLGSYGKSIEYSEKALELLSNEQDDAKSAFVLINLSYCYATAGEYTSAHLNLVKLLSVEARAQQLSGIGRYYLHNGWLCLKKAEYDQAYLSLQRALRLFTTLELPAYIGRAVLYLGMLHLWRGQRDVAERLAEQAAEIFRKLKDRVFIADAEFLKLQARSGTDQCTVAEDVVRIFDDYTESCNFLGAMNCLLFMMTAGLEDAALTCLRRQPKLRDYLDSAEIPLARGLKKMVSFWELKRQERYGDAVLELKYSHWEFREAKLDYSAAVVADLLARYYTDAGNLKWAMSYYEEEERLAKHLGNQEMLRRTSKRKPHLRRKDSNRSVLLRMLVEISKLLGSAQEYRSTQMKILRYAIEITGAERGVLLLYDGMSDSLRVESSFDCDTQSISDIKEISNSVIEKVREGKSPILIEDATQHSSTRDYKSIIQHNILSIVCVPMISRNRLVGVLYLDHHFIPGMFSREDHEVVGALGSLAAVALELSGQLRRLKAESSQNEEILKRHGIKTPIVTKARCMLNLLDRLHVVANSPTTVLLVGETGTGKELLARRIHDQSARSDGPYIAVNCARLDGHAADSEVFGVEERSFTDVNAREGVIERADGGTLFLDEIDSLPLATQGKLLRVLEEMKFTREGGTKVRDVDFRLVCASSKDLAELVESKIFRPELYFRIASVELHIPPLRDRSGDVMLLIDHFLALFGKDGLIEFSPEALAFLETYSWPGNVRELRNLIEHVINLPDIRIVDADDLPRNIQKEGRRSYGRVKSELDKIEAEYMMKALIKHRGNQSRAAREVGQALSTFRRKLKKHGINPADYH